MTSCQHKQHTVQHVLFKNKVDRFQNFSQKLILTVLSNLFRTLRMLCISTYILAYRNLYRFKEQNLEYTQWAEKIATHFVR
jgi:hypothetical protein